MSFKVAINRPRPIPKPRRNKVIAQTRTETSILKGSGESVYFIGNLDQQYGTRILEVLLTCCDVNTPIHTFNCIYFFVVFFPIIWFAIVSQTLSSICRTSRYPILTIFFSEVFLLTCLARYTAIMIILSTMVGGVALSAHPMTAGIKSLSSIVSDGLSRLENYFAQQAGSLQAFLEDIKILLPTRTEDEWCEVTSDDPKILSVSRSALLPPPLVEEKSTSPPRLFSKVTYEIQSQAQKHDFDPEGWLLV